MLLQIKKALIALFGKKKKKRLTRPQKNQNQTFPLICKSSGNFFPNNL